MLGDDAGRVFTNAILLPHFNKANRTLVRSLASLGSLRYQREVYYNLPANTGYLLPSQFGVADFMEPRKIEQRGSLTTFAVLIALNNTNFVRLTTTAPHTLQTGQQVTCQGIVGMTGTEGMWGISVPANNQIDLLGAVGVGTYASGGVVTYTQEEFQPVDKTETIEQFQAVGAQLCSYSWFDNALHFVPATTDRQLRIIFWASGPDISSTAASVGVDDVRDLLATLTAGYAARSRGATDKATSFLMEALGQDMNPDEPDGMLLQAIRVAIRQQQAIPPSQRRRAPFRNQMSPWPW